MIVEMTPDEAKLLIAVLAFAEGAALAMSPAMVLALADLRPWRSALLRAYLRECCGQPESGDAVGQPPSDPI